MRFDFVNKGGIEEERKDEFLSAEKEGILIS